MTACNTFSLSLPLPLLGSILTIEMGVRGIRSTVGAQDPPYGGGGEISGTGPARKGLEAEDGGQNASYPKMLSMPKE